MDNFFDDLTVNSDFKRIQFNELTLIEFDCPLTQSRAPIWTPHDFVVYVLNGRKDWHTLDSVVTLQKGEIAYVKKGGHIVQQYFDEGFCMLVFFLTDTVKKELSLSAASLSMSLQKPSSAHDIPTINKIATNPTIDAFFLSLMAYFKMAKPPADEVKKLKLLEFVHVLSTEDVNHGVVKHLLSQEPDTLSKLKAIMNQNYVYNLSVQAFAELCNRSVSSFRRDFQKCFKTNLSSWLLTVRVNHAAGLLSNTNLSVSQVALESGFENLSHFSRCFKDKIGFTPSQYRLRHKLVHTAK